MLGLNLALDKMRRQGSMRIPPAHVQSPRSLGVSIRMRFAEILRWLTSQIRNGMMRPRVFTRTHSTKQETTRSLSTPQPTQKNSRFEMLATMDTQHQGLASTSFSMDNRLSSSGHQTKLQNFLPAS